MVAVLLLVGCRHKKEPTNMVDSLSHRESHPAVSDEKGSETTLQLRMDTATRTDWRVVARKNTKIYSPTLLTGVWKNGNLHQLYRSDGTGLRWDESDNVDRTEGLAFSWVMDSNCLTMLFPMRLGGVVPKEYLVTYADDESLVYKDAYGTSYLWDKVPQDMNLELQ